MKWTVYTVFAVVLGLLATGAARGQTAFSIENQLPSFIAPSPGAELVAFGKRMRGAYWLHNDWIVYCINDKITFEKFVPYSPEPFFPLTSQNLHA